MIRWWSDANKLKVRHSWNLLFLPACHCDSFNVYIYTFIHVRRTKKVTKHFKMRWIDPCFSNCHSNNCFTIKDFNSWNCSLSSKGLVKGSSTIFFLPPINAFYTFHIVFSTHEPTTYKAEWDISSVEAWYYFDTVFVNLKYNV